MSTKTIDGYKPLYDVEHVFGVPGATPYQAGVRVDVQTGDMRVTSRAPVFLRVNGDTRPAFRCTSAQAREIASALNAAADFTDGHRV